MFYDLYQNLSQTILAAFLKYDHKLNISRNTPSFNTFSHLTVHRLLESNSHAPLVQEAMALEIPPIPLLT